MTGRYALPPWVTTHWQLKLLSVGLAILLWVFVASEERAETVFSVPVEFRQIPPGLEIVGGDSDLVDVRIQGLRSVLSRLGSRELRVTVNLREARAGEATVRLTPAEVHAPRGVQVLRVTPSRLRLHLEAVATPGTPRAPERPEAPASLN